MAKEFKKYIGTKEIEARPCTADEADEILGRKVCRDGSYSVAEALSFIPGVKVVEDENNGRKLAFD